MSWDMLYGSIMEKTGLLEALLSKMDPLVKSTDGLVTAVVLTCTLLLMATASQTLAIVVGGRMYIGEFKKKNLLPQTLSRTLEDSGTIISPLVPWSLCGRLYGGHLGGLHHVVSALCHVLLAVPCTGHCIWLHRQILLEDRRKVQPESLPAQHIDGSVLINSLR